MNKLIRETDINEDWRNYLQRLQYEVNGYKVLLTSMMEVKEFSYSGEHYERLMRDYQLANAAMQLAIAELNSELCPESFYLEVETRVFFDALKARFYEKPTGGGSCAKQNIQT